MTQTAPLIHDRITGERKGSITRANVTGGTAVTNIERTKENDMASPNLLNGVAKQFLSPGKIDLTEKMLITMHLAAVEAKDALEALTVGQLLTEVGKLKRRLSAPPKAEKAEKPAAAKK
jgi:hypothetical protein